MISQGPFSCELIDLRPSGDSETNTIVVDADVLQLHASVLIGFKTDEVQQLHLLFNTIFSL
jgi:hypothetical protein